jgi:hypothetical protein
MITLSEEYTFYCLREGLMDKTGQDDKETKLGRTGKYAAVQVAGAAAGHGIATAAGGAMAVVPGAQVAALGAYYLYRKHKKAKAAASMEQDPSKKNAMNAKANQMKQDANKKKILDQKKERLQKQMQRA